MNATLNVNHLSKNNKGCALVGTKTLNDNNKNKHNNHFECLYHICQPLYLICTLLQSNVHHVDV